MLKYVLGSIGIISSVYLIRHREAIGDMIGENDIMRKIGGTYMIVVYVALIIFFWSIAELTNTTDILFAPLKWLIPGANVPPPQDFVTQ